MIVTMAMVICLALNNYHEGRGEIFEGQVAIADVVLNRVADPGFPDNICDVVHEDTGPEPWDCQFSWWCDGLSDVPKDIDAYREALELAIDVLGHRVDSTDGALYYRTKRPHEFGVFIKQIGNHYFSKD